MKKLKDCKIILDVLMKISKLSTVNQDDVMWEYHVECLKVHAQQLHKIHHKELLEEQKKIDDKYDPQAGWRS